MSIGSGVKPAALSGVDTVTRSGARANVMVISKLLEWRDNRHRLAALRYDLEDSAQAFQRKIIEKNLKRRSDEYEQLYWDHDTNRQLIESEIDQIETKNLIARAKSWGVPIPSRPSSESEENIYWYWCRVHGHFYLTDEGKALLRREAYAEMEMRFKPWVTWLALSISVVSLAVSLLKW